jgi:hypothetical protein
VSRLTDLIADLAEIAARAETVLEEAEDLGAHFPSSGGLTFGVRSGAKPAEEDPTGEAATSPRLARIRSAARYLRRCARAPERELTRGLAAVESAGLTAYDPELARTTYEVAGEEEVAEAREGETHPQDVTGCPYSKGGGG